MTVIASYTDGFNTVESVSSAATAVVTNVNDLPVGTVAVSDTSPQQGQLLVVTKALTDLDGLGTLSYTWSADNTVLGTGFSYKPSQAQVGKALVVTVSYTDGFNKLESISSLPTDAVANSNDRPTGKVFINDATPSQGQHLTVVNTLADVDGLGTLSYSWLIDNTEVGTGNRYQPIQADVGKAIVVTARYTDGFNTLETVSSAASTPVANVNDLPTGSVTISNTSPLQGQLLKVSDTLADLDGLGMISYAWKTGRTLLGTGNSYTPSQTTVGKAITVIASYTDGSGHAETVSSTATSAVTAPYVAPGFTISPMTTQLTNENGAVASYSIRLNTAPIVNQNVSITFTSSDTTEGVIDSPLLQFTSKNYAKPQTLTVRGVDDFLDDGDIPYLVTAKVTTLDIFYKSLTLNALNLSNTDDGFDKALDLYGDQGGSKSDVLTGGNGADKLHGKDMADNLSGGIGNDTLWGGYGDDNLFGEDGNDVLWGEQENDYLMGGNGNDTLDGGEGMDTMIGGAGNDVYYLGYDAVDVITDKGLSTDVDTVIMPYQLSKYTLPVGIEQGTISAGTQASSLTGNDSDNTLTGNDGGNVLNGAVGRDSLFGGLGDDVINGGTDDDVLQGGVGNDRLTGGSGSDSFLFDTALKANVDNITDFQPVDDTIKLENQLFTKLTVTGVLDASLFVKGANALDPNDYVIYNPATGAVTYDSDGSGIGQGFQIALLGINLSITNADFIVQ